MLIKIKKNILFVFCFKEKVISLQCSYENKVEKISTVVCAVQILEEQDGCVYSIVSKIRKTPRIVRSFFYTQKLVKVK